MKRKVSLSENQRRRKLQKQETNMPSDLMNIDFLLSQILGFMPAYRLVGKNAITSVSKTWKRLLTENKFYNKKYFNALLASCQQDPQGALHILSDETFIPHLTFKQLFKIAGCNNELAKSIISNPTAESILDSEDLEKLAEQHSDIAMAILKNPQFCFKLMGSSLLGKLGLKYLEVAVYILHTPEFYRRLSNRNLIELAQQHLEVANYLHNNPGSLTNDDLLLIDSAYFEKAENIVKNPELYNNLSGEQIAILGQRHLSIAQIILNTPTLCSKLSISQLCMLAQNHVEIAQHMLNKDDFCNEVSGEDLMMLGIKNPEIANLIFDDAKLFVKLNANAITQLGAHHLQIAKRILKMSELQLSPQHLCFMGYCHSEVAEHILNTPALCDELSGGELAKLGENHEEIAERIINTTTFWDKLTAENLVKLSRQYSKITKLILNNPLLFDKIVAASQLNCFTRNFTVADFENLYDSPDLSLAEKAMGIPMDKYIKIDLIKNGIRETANTLLQNTPTIRCR
ncbi:MAG: hypothetical protein BGO43_01170 [Gammaproteobacteria bacterium 39-13]|nr:MAG: hypothetical protein BGO43_01170 [Gammaproteobacteria bacterium 39-13]